MMSENDFPQYTFAGSTAVVLNNFGLYTYVGSADSVWTMPALAETTKRRTAKVFFIVNRSTGKITLTPINSEKFYYDGSATQTTYIIYPGQSGIVYNDGNVWCVLGNINGKLYLDATNTATGTTGAQTINKPTGTVNFAASAISLTVTNSLVTTSSIVYCVIRTNDATAKIRNVVPAAGSFTITLDAATTAETSVGFIVFN